MNGKHPLLQLQRKGAIAATQPDRFVALRAAAENLSRRNLDAAVVELLSEAVCRVTALAFEQEEGGGLCNVDPVSWRLLIAAPWGRAGYARWGLRPAEGIVLREMMQQRQWQTATRAPGFFLYERARRAWTANFFDWDNLADALGYWERWPLSVHEYRAARTKRLGGNVGGEVAR